MYKTEQKPRIKLTLGYYHVSFYDECPFLHLWNLAFDWCYDMNGKKYRKPTK
jgi:hypothetical protein